MPKGRVTTFDAFYEAVEALKAHPEQYKGLSIPAASERLTQYIGKPVARSAINAIFDKAGVQRTTTPRGRAASKMKTEMLVSRGVIRTFLNMGAVPAEIDKELLEMAGWDFKDLVSTADDVHVEQLTMAAMASVSEHH